MEIMKKMNKFRSWYQQNVTEINWFVIGMLTATGIERFGQGDFDAAIVFWAIAFANYYLNRK
jgi:hypothetical protein